MHKKLFSPRSELLLGHIATIREVKRLWPELERDCKSFLQYLKNNIADLIPGLRGWNKTIEANALYLRPESGWSIVKDDYIAITVSWSELIDLTFLSDEADPYVGLYVPKYWRGLTKLTHGLRRVMPRGFRHNLGNPEYDETVPIWTYVHVSKYMNGRIFDSDRFLKDTVKAVDKLFGAKKGIDMLIKQIQAQGRKNNT